MPAAAAALVANRCRHQDTLVPMLALHLGPDGLRLRPDHPTPQPQAGEALIRINKAGVCATDLQLMAGYAGFRGILGHEFVGVVEASDDPSWSGRRVVGSINLGCGQCRVCAVQGAEHCPQRRVLGIRGHDGVFAQFARLPLANLLPVAESLADEEAVFAEPLAAALRISQQIPLPPTAEQAVLGPGKLGLLVAQVLALGGGQPRVLGRHRQSLELATRLGLEVGLASEEEEARYDLVVEATGNASGLASAIRLTKPGGTLVLKSTFAQPAATDLSPLVVKEIRLVGSRCGPFAPALRLLAQGAIQVLPLIEADYPLARGLAALEHAGRPGARKILLSP